MDKFHDFLTLSVFYTIFKQLNCKFMAMFSELGARSFWSALNSMGIIFAFTVFQVSSDLLFKSEFFEEIQINKLNLLAIENTIIIVPKWYM
jgi:hypothetical protein